uniref:DDB1- and CUL4-associated factor 12 beta-propeller domain-containing protein n=1 Tax=Trichobilharzia regenti TaxID=157069 RepID=A0AA85J0R4_TRIRE|nr:unnamed protein product [Trichobilharzia regenti]
MLPLTVHLQKDCHKDWVFDLRWLDDTCLASCSRDSSLALWRIPSSDENVSGRVNNSIHKNTGVKSGTSVLHIKSPVAYAKSSLSDDRFRALEYLPTQTNLAVVSMSRRLYLYDAVRMGLDKHTRPIYTLVLRNAYPEAVALRRWPSEPNCIALATHHCVLLFDIRCSTTKIGSEARCILPPLDVAGVRSLNFSKSILSYGTSSGRVHFYDLRNDHHLPKQLDIGPGWVKPQNCDDYEIPAVASLLNSLSRPVASQSQTTTTGWNVPSPPPSPAHPVLITSSSNIVRPIQPQHQQQSQSEAFATQVTNLHLRLNRINNRILNLHSRHRALSMYPIMNRSTSRRSNNTHNRNGIIRQNSITTTTTTTSAEDVATSSLSESNFPDVDDDNNNNDDDDNDDDGNDGGGDADGDDTHPATNNDTAIVNPVDINNNDINVLSSGGGRGRGGGESRRITLGMNFFADLNFDLFSFPTIFNQRRMLAVYTHEYDPSGTRLFTAGGPIASTFHGNVAALWE